MLPVPEQVNFSESGLSFYSERELNTGSYIHVTLSHPENFFHIAATAQVVYSREEENGHISYRGVFYYYAPSRPRQTCRSCCFRTSVI